MPLPPLHRLFCDPRVFKGSSIPKTKVSSSPKTQSSPDMGRSSARPRRVDKSTSSRIKSSTTHGTFSEGAKVLHKTYGVGVIHRIERRGSREVARVQFAERERVILLSFLTDGEWA